MGVLGAVPEGCGGCAVSTTESEASDERDCTNQRDAQDGMEAETLRLASDGLEGYVDLFCECRVWLGWL